MTQLVLVRDILDEIGDPDLHLRKGTRVTLVSCKGDYVIASHTNQDGNEVTFALQRGDFNLYVEKYAMQIKNVYASEDVAEDVIAFGISRVARSLKDEPEKLAKLIGEVMNSFGNAAEFGEQTGKAMHREHRTLQRLIIIWAFNLIRGISQQEFTDPRNEDAIEAAKKLAQMIDEFDTMNGVPIFTFGSFV